MSCHCESGHCECKHEDSKKEIIIKSIRVALSLTLALLGTFLWNEETVGLWINLAIMVGAYLIISYDVILEMIRGFKEGEFFGEETLMVLASIGAFALRAYGSGHNSFLEAVLVILLYQVGEVLEDLASDRSRKAIVSAIDLREELALVEVDGQIVERKAEDLKVGDIVVLNAGRKIYCDGVIIKGQGLVDESSLTGEALPVHKENESEVKSGTFLTSGSLKARVTCDYEDSTVAKLLNLIEEGAEEKSKATRFITRFSKVFTPAAIGVALLLAVVPPLIEGMGNGEVWSKWIYIALSALVISCPCAVVISVPLAYFSGLGLASKKGILVKGASYFDAGSQLDIIAFDKTGTLTEAKVGVTPVVFKEKNQEGILRLAAAAESLSSHPLGKAIHSLFPEVSLDEKDHVEEVSSLGIKAQIDGHDVLVGKEKLLVSSGVEIESEKGLVDVYFAVDGKHVGGFLIKDEIKVNSKQTIADLRTFGIKSVLLSGDKENRAKAISNELGCDSYRAELLPEEKQSTIREFKTNGSSVAFVGDGINDAPSLALADVGIAMGSGGADAVLENADVVIVDDDPGKVATFLRILNRTKNTAKFNIVFSLSVKALVLCLSLIAGLTGAFSLPLWVAVLADSGLAVLMVFNSLWLYFRKIA